MSKRVNIGAVTAYGIAKKNGYSGTEEQWIQEVTANAEAMKTLVATDDADVTDHTVMKFKPVSEDLMVPSWEEFQEAIGNVGGKTVLQFDGYRVKDADGVALTYQQVRSICVDTAKNVELIYRNYRFQPRVLDEFIEFTSLQFDNTSANTSYIRMLGDTQFETSGFALATYNQLGEVAARTTELSELFGELTKTVANLSARVAELEK